MLHLKTLGELRQASDDGAARPLRRKPLALVAYLARRSPRAVSRTELATLFWGERGEERARQSLRQALLELKQALGDAVDIDTESVRLQPDQVRLDLTAFEQDISAGRLVEAIERWTGDFFEGADDIGGDGFRRWIENERTGLHQQLGVAMEKLIGDAELRGDWAAAAARAEQWAAALPFEERAHLRLIEALRMNGRSGEALQVHAAFVSRMRTALDVEPSAEFLRLGGGLADDARSELARQGRGSVAVHEPQLVGRAAILSELLEAWKRVGAGGPIVVLIRGQAGSGRSRMAEELAERVTAEGVMLRAGAGANAGDLATATLLFDGLRTAPGSAGAAPEALAEVTRIVPALAQQFRHLPSPAGTETTLRDALVTVLAAVSEERPVLILLDDLQLADDVTKRLLIALAPKLSGRILMVLTEDEAHPQAGNALSAQLGARGPRRLQLPELSPAEVESMIGSMVLMDPADRHALAVRIHRDTGGTPLPVRELIVALVDDHLLTLDPAGTWQVSPVLAGRSLPIPAPLREQTRNRLAPLSSPARAVTDALAVLGESTDVTVAAGVAELTPDDAESALGELVAARVLREEPARPGYYTFASPLMARAVGALLPPTRRQALHARAAQVLTERDLASTAERSLLPYHLARAERTSGATATRAIAPPARRRWLVAALLLAVVAVGAAVWRPWNRRAAPPSNAVPIIALGRITDYRENPASDLTRPLTDMLATNLGRVPRLQVVSTARIYELVNQADSGSALQAAAMVAAARRAGATELVDGALYARENGGYRLDLRRVNLGTGNIQQTYSVVGVTVFDLADSGTARLAADFGQLTPLGSIADVTTKSEAAYRLYEEGLRAYYANDVRGAEPLFVAALAEDSTFAMAAYYSALTARDGRRVVLARFALASRLAQRATERERLIINARLAFLSSYPGLVAIADTLISKYPQEVDGYYYKGLGLDVQGRFQEALAPLNHAVQMDSLAFNGTRPSCAGCEAMREIVSSYQLMDSLPAALRELKRWIRLSPQSPVPLQTLADVYTQMGRPAEALQALDQQAALDKGRKEDIRLVVLAVHRISAGDFEQADRLLAAELETGAPTRMSNGAWYRSISYRYQGRLLEALADARRYRRINEGRDAPEMLASRRAQPPEALGEAQVLYDLHQYRESAVLFDSVSRWVATDELPSENAHARAWALTHAAGSLAAAGDTAGVLALVDTIEVVGGRSASRRDQLLHHYVRGLILVARHQDPAAVEEFRKSITSWNFGYTRANMAMARAYLRLNRPLDAIAALQPALRGVIEASNFYVSRTDVHVLLGDAWAAVGTPASRDSAAAHYAYVERAWSKADPSFDAERQRIHAARVSLSLPGAR